MIEIIPQATQSILHYFIQVNILHPCVSFFFSFLLQKSLEKCRSDLQLKNNVIRQLISQSENATFTSHQNLKGVNYSHPLTQTDSMRMRLKREAERITSLSYLYHRLIL